MLKTISIGLLSIAIFAGCSSKSANTSRYSVAEATDYAMSCDSLLNEINVIKAKIYNDENLLEALIPDYLKGKEVLSEEDIIILSERKKSLQLIYTLKQNKNECRALTVADTKQNNDGTIVTVIKETKNVVNEIAK